MARKTSSNILRLNITQTWKSKWFDTLNYSKLLSDDIIIRKYFTRLCYRVKLIISECKIQRTEKSITIILNLYNKYAYRISYFVRRKRLARVQRSIRKICSLPTSKKYRINIIIQQHKNIYLSANTLIQFLTILLQIHRQFYGKVFARLKRRFKYSRRKPRYSRYGLKKIHKRVFKYINNRLYIKK